MKTLHERLFERPSTLTFTEADAKTIQEAFDNKRYPVVDGGELWNGLYLFYDGTVKPDTWAKQDKCYSRNGQLVSIWKDGIPMYVSRIGFDHWKRKQPTSPPGSVNLQVD